MAPSKQAKGETVRPNPRIPVNVMKRVRALAKRRGESVNVALLELVRAGLKALT